MKKTSNMFYNIIRYRNVKAHETMVAEDGLL